MEVINKLREYINALITDDVDLEEVDRILETLNGIEERLEALELSNSIQRKTIAAFL